MGLDLFSRFNLGDNRIKLLSILILLLFVPVLCGGSNYVMHFFVLCFIWAVVAEAWNLIMGYAGIFSFGQLAFFTIGAFAAGLITNNYGISPWIGMLLAGVVTAVFGFLIGLPSLRLKGEYVCLVTYGLHLLLTPLILRASPIGVEKGGFIWNIPTLNLFGFHFERIEVLPWYYVGLILSTLLLISIYLVNRSSIGRALVALRDAEPLAQSIGVNGYKYKIIVFILSAFFTGVIGGFYAYYVGTVSTKMLGLDYFVMALIMVIIGGLGIFPGGAIGAFIITLVFELMRPLIEYRLILLGIIVLLTVIYLPNGVMSLNDKLSRTNSHNYNRNILSRLVQRKEKMSGSLK